MLHHHPPWCHVRAPGQHQHRTAGAHNANAKPLHLLQFMPIALRWCSCPHFIDEETEAQQSHDLSKFADDWLLRAPLLSFLMSQEQSRLCWGHCWCNKACEDVFLAGGWEQLSGSVCT
jgi:hypothetical protein